MTRSAISPRLAIKTFLNMRSRSGGGGRFETGPASVARAGDTLHAEGELAGTGGEEHRALVGDDALRVPRHDGLVEALHAVLHCAFADEVGNVEHLVHVPDLVAHSLR